MPLEDDELELENVPPADDGQADRVALLEQSMTGMAEIIKTLANGQTSLQSSIQQLSESLTTANQPIVEPEHMPDDVDLETMSRRDLIALIQGNLDKRIKESLNPLTTQLSGIDERLNNAITSVTVEKFQDGHPDLMEWKGEIAELFKAGRASTVADAYVLARQNDPEKTKTIDTKYKPVTRKPDVPRLGFQGFPTEGGQGSGKNTRMTLTQAAASAWDEATANMPGIDQFLNSDMN